MVFGFPMVQKQDGCHIISLDRFIHIFKFFLYTKWSRLAYLRQPSCFLDHSKSEQNVRFSNGGSKTEPFNNETTLDHSKSKRVRYSSPHCISKVGKIRVGNYAAVTAHCLCRFDTQTHKHTVKQTYKIQSTVGGLIPNIGIQNTLEYRTF